MVNFLEEVTQTSLARPEQLVKLGVVKQQPVKKPGFLSKIASFGSGAFRDDVQKDPKVQLEDLGVNTLDIDEEVAKEIEAVQSFGEDEFFNDVQTVMADNGIDYDTAFDETLKYYKSKGFGIEGINIDEELGITVEGEITVVEDEIPEPREEGLISELGERAEAVGSVFERQKAVSAETGEGLVGAAQRAAIPLRSAVQIVGEGFGAAGDVIGSGVITGFKALGSLVSAVTPDIVEDTVKGVVGDAGTAFLQSETGQAAIGALQGGIESYQSFKQANPETAETLEAIGNIASFLPIPKVGGLVTKETGKVLGVTGEALQESAEKTIKRNIDDFAQELVSPIKNKKSVIDDISKGRVQEGGMFKGRTRNPTEQELGIADEVKKIEGFGPGKTSLENNNLILEQIGKLDDVLISSLEKNPVLIPRIETKAFLKKARNELSDNPLLVGDAQKTADKVLDQFGRFIDEQPGNARGVLEARRQLDTWIKQQKPKAFDTDSKLDALEIALTKIRTTANDLVDARVKSVPVKKLLNRESNLFRAIEQTAPKARLEAGSAIGRLMQKIKTVTGLKGEVVTGLGLIGGTTAVTLAPTALGIAGGLGIGALGIKGLISPTTRNFLGKRLKQIDNIIQKTPNPDLQALKTEIEDLISNE